MKKIRGDCFLFALGGIVYGMIEILYRHKTHWTMLITGGACFLSIFKIYKRHQTMKMLPKCVLGSAVITLYEFICGCIVNLKFKMKVWDYSNCRFNIKGQICPFYSMLWGFLCIPINAVCKKICSKKFKSLKV